MQAVVSFLSLSSPRTRGTTPKFWKSEDTMNSETPWTLDPQLARDTVVVGELTLSRVLAMNDANYPWLILVPRHAGAVEIIDLANEQQADLMDEIAFLSR